MGAKPSPNSLCFARQPEERETEHGPQPVRVRPGLNGWPQRPVYLAQPIEVVDNGDGTVTATATGVDGGTVSKTVSVDDPGLRWETSETPPRIFKKREQADAREANMVGGS